MTNILVLCAGKGQRFKDAGYDGPKPLIDVDGVPMVKRTTDSIRRPSGTDRLAFAVLTKDVVVYDMSARLKDIYGQGIHIVEFPDLTRGNLETAYEAVSHLIGRCSWKRDEAILILDSDNMYDGSQFWVFIDTLEKSSFSISGHGGAEPGRFGVVCYFEPLDDKTHWCFVQMKGKTVYNILEKHPAALEVGGKPIVGTFYFTSAKLFMDVASDVITMNIRSKGEFYMSQAMEGLLEFDIPVYGHKVTEVVPLGTPEDLKKFLGEVWNFKQLIIAIDLDDTINHAKKPNEEYGNEKLQESVIEVLRRWKKQGHHIVIHTARHMNTCDGNLGKVLARQGLTTLQWLQDNDVPYDEIWWSKPHADIFIDDKGLRHTPGDWHKTEKLVNRFARGEKI
jgi:capsule biosynthesis phosphatase